ncbi:MAG: von Willebrand factor type A domain-containing protein [Chloroflexota bacterium]
MSIQNLIRQKRNLFIVLIILMMIVAACGGSAAEPASEESGGVIAQSPAIESPTEEEAMEEEEDYVEIVAEEYEDEMMEEVAADEAPIVVAPAEIEPAPTAVPERPDDRFFEDYGVNPFILTSVDNLSTFALDVDTASYSISRRYLQDGQLPPANAVRVEEFVNSFEQGYSTPPDAAFAVYADGAPSPYHNDGTHFLRFGVKGFEVAEEERPSANLTFVIDVSGSMSGDRLALVKESLNVLVDRMRRDDVLSIVVYGSDARVVLPPTRGSERAEILTAVYSLGTEGSTNLEAGLLLGYDQANRAYMPNGINRVILASDGVANVGDTGPNSLSAKIRSYADAGIQLTTLGVGIGDFNDTMMEQLADQGDGNYAYIDTLEEAEEIFIDKLMSTLQTIAIDAKIQVAFDSNVVERYRLVGYENRAVADEDFRNNDVDAGEIGAGHSVAAIYAVQFVPGAQGRIATVNLRWQDPDSRQVREISGDFGTDNLAASFDDAPLYHQLAVVVSQTAEILRESYWADGVTWDDLRIRSERLAAQLGMPEVQEFAELVAEASRLQ